MKNARMGRLDGLLSGLNKALFPLSSPRNFVGDLPLCRRITRTNNRFPTTTFGNDGHDNHDNNRSWTTTFQDDGNNYYTASRGFTLIELLVVVLIIGILAAVAVPQYQLVVDKTKWRKEMIPIKALERALEAYYMGNGVYPDDNLAGIDIDISGCYEYGSGQVKCGTRPEADKTSNWIDYNGGLKYEQRGLGSFIDINSINARIYLPHSGVLSGKMLCRAYPGDHRRVRLCKSLGGVLYSEKFGSSDQYLID